ncbi:hypothetical protein NDU88_011669 [Pleurodeles waltl]|uniref:WAP domain-containing protein n=1 Tax=Pleurodeles waltl TaxID=8319 RepID=A0AAV7S1W6_PLEWA|nr:hypothetical protein NDU88_011669 [Pleurodeles waltl]
MKTAGCYLLVLALLLGPVFQICAADKPGSCPWSDVCNLLSIEKRCTGDEGCEGAKKCCRILCDFLCVDAVEESFVDLLLALAPVVMHDIPYTLRGSF